MVVVVVGAGVAGLACAAALRQCGVTDVVVVEATEQVGGRVATDRTLIPGVDVALGAELVHGNTNLVVDMASAHGWRLHQTFTWAQGDGGPSDEASPTGGAGYYFVAGEGLYRFDRPSADMARLHDLLWGIGDLSPDDAARHGTLEAYLRHHSVPPAYRELACAGYANTAGGTLASLSLPATVKQEQQWSSDGNHDFLMQPSTQVIVDHLVKGVRVLRRWPVTRVAVGTDRRAVVTSATGSTLVADAVVVTASPPVLAAGVIEFQPPLCASRVAALHRVAMPNGVKLHLSFSRRCWPEDADGVVFGGCFVPEMWFRSGTRPDGTPFHLVTCFAMAARADAMAAVAEATAMALAVSQVCTVFQSDAHRYFLRGSRVVWADHPFVRGAYTSASVAEAPGDREELAKPHAGVVLFAGEVVAGVTGSSPMTLHGTMESGITAAHAVASLLGVTARPGPRL